jgi:hypothetical protein
MPAPDLFTLLKKVWTKHNISPVVTLRSLSLGAIDGDTGWYAKSFATSSINMYLFCKAANFLVLKQGLFIDYDAIGIAKDTVVEGDEIVSAGLTYTAITVCRRYIATQYIYSEIQLKQHPLALPRSFPKKWTHMGSSPFEKMRRTIEKNSMRSSDMKHYVLSLGAADTETGWYLPTYAAAATIHCFMLDVTQTFKPYPAGLSTTYLHVGYTLSDVSEGDILKDASCAFHRVRTVKPHQIGDTLLFYELSLELLDDFTVFNLGVRYLLISLSSVLDTDPSTVNLGTIAIDSDAPTTLPGTDTIGGGVHTASFVHSLGYAFDHWVPDANIIVVNTAVNPATFTVVGCVGGSLQAVFKSACPSGEQILNGGFETGDMTSWTTVSGTPQVVTYQHKDGAYACRTGRNQTCVISQVLGTPVPVSCIIAKFSLWVRSDYSVSPPGGSIFTVKIVYDDATFTTVTHSITVGEADTWIEMNLIPYLDAGKTVVSIQITFNGYVSTLPYIDSVSLVP